MKCELAKIHLRREGILRHDSETDTISTSAKSEKQTGMKKRRGYYRKATQPTD